MSGRCAARGGSRRGSAACITEGQLGSGSWKDDGSLVCQAWLSRTALFLTTAKQGVQRGCCSPRLLYGQHGCAARVGLALSVGRVAAAGLDEAAPLGMLRHLPGSGGRMGGWMGG